MLWNPLRGNTSWGNLQGQESCKSSLTGKSLWTYLLSTVSPRYVSFTLVEYKIDSGLRRQIISMDFSLLIYKMKNFGGMTSKFPFNWKVLYLQKTKGKKKISSSINYVRTNMSDKLVNYCSFMFMLISVSKNICVCVYDCLENLGSYI